MGSQLVGTLLKLGDKRGSDLQQRESRQGAPIFGEQLIHTSVALISSAHLEI